MENNWVKVYTTGNPVEASIILSMLHENDIEAVEINKIDSSYPVFGNAEIYCTPEQAIKATHLIHSRNEE